MAVRKAAAVSMDEQLNELAKERARRLGFSTFSAYVVQLIRQDLADRESGITLREDPVIYGASNGDQRKMREQ